MPFIGNQPALSYTSFAKQDFTTSATTSYTLDHPVTNENEIALFINFVRQEPTTAYTASNTNLNLTSATSASDDMYCVFLGKAIQTVNPPAGSVGASQISDSSIALGKLSATGTKDATTFLRGDNTFASAGGDNTPAFNAYVASNTSISNGTYTTISMTEDFDTDNAFASNTFTVPSGQGGKYYFNFVLQVYAIGNIIVIARLENSSGTQLLYNRNEFNSSSYALFAQNEITCSGILTLSAGDTVIPRAYATTFDSSATNIAGESTKSQTRFFGCKLIGI